MKEPINAIIYNGKVYVTSKNNSCADCSFAKESRACFLYGTACYQMRCSFKFSQELTDKLQ